MIRINGKEVDDQNVAAEVKTLSAGWSWAIVSGSVADISGGPGQALTAFLQKLGRAADNAKVYSEGEGNNILTIVVFHT